MGKEKKEYEQPNISQVSDGNIQPDGCTWVAVVLAGAVAAAGVLVANVVSMANAGTVVNAGAGINVYVATNYDC